MATATRAVKVHESNGSSIYVTPSGLRIGARGKVQDTGNVLGTLDKGTARKVRKELRKLGHGLKAAARRVVA